MSDSSVSQKLGLKLCERQDRQFLEDLALGKVEIFNHVLPSDRLITWSAKQIPQITLDDIVPRLHLLAKKGDARWQGFIFHGEAIYYEIVYLNRKYWERGRYRETSFGENKNQVIRLLHLYLKTELNEAPGQRNKAISRLLRTLSKIYNVA